jgi:hypothetical protein
LNVTTESKTNEKMQYWKNPENQIVYEMYQAPGADYKFTEGEAIMDLGIKQNNVRLAKQGLEHKQKDIYLDTKFASKVDQYIHDIRQGGAVKQAALHSSTNSAVDILNVFGEVFGKLDRKYAGKNLAREIPVPNLVIDIDSVSKFTGMTRIGEMSLPSNKELTYSRQHFEARKFGLMFEISEESQLKNVHNVLQDSIQVASNKLEQRASYDVIDIAKTLTSNTSNAWDTFTASTDHSTNNPLDDILESVSNIEGAGQGGRADRIGMHLFTNAKYVSNTNIRGVANTGPAPGFEFEPGTSSMIGMPNVGLVLDNAIPQGVCYVTSVEVEPTIAYFQGPQRVGSKHNEITGSDEYFIIDYHLASSITANSGSGEQLTSVATPRSF